MTTDSKKSGGFVGGLFGMANSAGKLWRDQVQPGLATARTRMEAMKEVPAQARALWNSRTPEGREIMSRVAALQARIDDGVSAAITGLRGIAAVGLEALQGMDQRLALRLLELHALETVATARAALTHPAVTEVKQKFQQLKEDLETNPEADVTSQLEDLSAAIANATTAVKAVPVTEAELRRLFVTLLGTCGEFDLLTLEYSEQAEAFVDRFGAATLSDDIDPALVTDLKPRVEALRRQLLDRPLESAVDVCVLADEANLLHARYVAVLTFIAGQTQRLRSLEGLMNTMVTRAEEAKVNSDATLLRAAREFIKATRQKPIDLTAAESHKDAYIDRLEELDP